MTKNQLGTSQLGTYIFWYHFIDDNKQNIIGAEKLGIKGYLFDGNVAALSEYLDKILKKLE